MELSAEGATLSAILVSIVSLIIGKIWGSHGRVSDRECAERRGACNNVSKVTCDTYNRRLNECEADIRELLNKKN